VVIAQRDRGRRRTDRVNAGRVILSTGRLDPPAAVIAAVSELRWSIGRCFRFRTQVLGLKRLFSGKPEAVAIPGYGAGIACLRLAHAVGGRVPTDADRMPSFYL
jgi:IS4 transposase